MTVGEVIHILEQLPQGTIVENGFENGHAYRGLYDEFAVEPCQYVTVEAMLETLESHDGIHTAWKGGEYTYNLSTPIHLAYEGSTGVEMDADYMNEMKIVDRMIDGDIT